MLVGGMPDLRQLRTFVAVAEELNFTRAAARLHLAQQAVSKAVRQLERELGVELLERTTREVRLTAAGAALLDSGRGVLAAADDAFARARAIGGGRAGTVRVAVSPACGYAVRDEVTAVLRAGAPDVAVSLLEVRPGEVEQLLRDRDVDFVLARAARIGAGIESVALRPTPAVLAVPAGHRLAGAGTVALAELHGERLLTWSAPGTPYTDLLVARLAAAGARVEPVESRVTGSGSLPELGELGAVAVVPAGWPPREGIVLLAVRDNLTLPLILMWPAGAPSPAVQRVREAMSGPAHSPPAVDAAGVSPPRATFLRRAGA
jgi:DNA-binding transcriptional LysR family regulator